MSDLVERLREVDYPQPYETEGNKKLRLEAADEIERLREFLSAIHSESSGCDLQSLVDLCDEALDGQDS